MTLTEKHINDYLHFGYIPGRNTEKVLIEDKSLFSCSSSANNEDKYIAEGRKILNEVFDEMVENISPDDKHLIPLSGGLDSRIIFASLQQRINPEKLEIITFGSPGTWDFDIPVQIYSKFPTSDFKQLDCTKIIFAIEDLIEATKDGGEWTSIPDNYINRLALKEYQEHRIWSGFIGDFVAGSYSTKGLNRNVVKTFVENETRSKNLKLTASSYNPEKSVVRAPNLYNSSITDYELLTLYNRIPASTAPILFPLKKDILTPLTHPSWVNFMFNLPMVYRSNTYLLKKIFIKEFPNWNFKTKNNLGLALNNNSDISRFRAKIKIKTRLELAKFFRTYKFPPLATNYLFYPEAIRSHQGLRSSIELACNSLEERRIVSWLSPNKVLFDHIKRKEDFSQALLLLLGLEVNLRAMHQ